METAQVFINTWMDQENVAMQYYSPIKGNPAICDSMDESGGHYAKQNCMVSLIHGI